MSSSCSGRIADDSSHKGNNSGCGANSGLGPFGQKDPPDEVCDLGGRTSIENMKKCLRGVPFSRCTGMSVKLAAAASADTCRLTSTSREAALVGDAAPLSGEKPAPARTSSGAILRIGLLHRAGNVEIYPHSMRV